jgi:hypothetical protein
MDLVNIFFFLASISLLRLVYEDMLTFKVDERISHYMFGAVAVIFLFQGLIVVWLGFMVLITLGLGYVKEKLRLEQRKVFGAGDLTIISWLLPALFVLNLSFGICFVLLWCIGNITMFFIAKKQKMPGTIPMFIALSLTWFLQIAKLI